MDQKAIEEASKELGEAIKNNAQPTPYLTIDPESETPAVVGNPNEVPTKSGDYIIYFYYPEEEISDLDKAKMEYDADTRCYISKVTYEKRRVKPLYRGKIVTLLTKLMTEVNVVRKDGYTEDLDLYALGQALLNNPTDIANVAKLVLDIPDSQIPYIAPKSLIGFVNQLLDNEPNILKESQNFLV